MRRDILSVRHLLLEVGKLLFKFSLLGYFFGSVTLCLVYRSMCLLLNFILNVSVMFSFHLGLPLNRENMLVSFM